MSYDKSRFCGDFVTINVSLHYTFSCIIMHATLAYAVSRFYGYYFLCI